MTDETRATATLKAFGAWWTRPAGSAQDMIWTVTCDHSDGICSACAASKRVPDRSDK